MIGANVKKQIRVAAYLFVKNEQGEVLFTRTKAGPREIWNLPGGSMDFGEGVEEGLKRELMEELSLNADIGNLLHLTRGVHVNPDFPNSQLFGCYFAPKAPEQIKKHMQSGEHGQDVLNIQWLDPETIDPNDVLSVDIEFFETQNIEIGKKFKKGEEKVVQHEGDEPKVGQVQQTTQGDDLPNCTESRDQSQSFASSSCPQSTSIDEAIPQTVSENSVTKNQNTFTALFKTDKTVAEDISVPKVRPSERKLR